MEYQIDIDFKPLNEAISSLHTYICRKSHKKLDLSASWAQETRARLTPELANWLDELSIDQEWKFAFLLVYLSPEADVPGFVNWLSKQSTGELYERMSPYSSSFPVDMNAFKAKLLKLFTLWQNQYFEGISPEILRSLEEVAAERRAVQSTTPAWQFVDETTNGLIFEPITDLNKLVLIPQYHFQPINIVSHFNQLTLCYYSARVDLSDDDFMSAHDYRILRSLGEKSRLKILRYLHQGPRTFIEIHRYLKLSKGITHDHISKLRSAGLIHAHFEGENLTLYSLRAGALDRLQHVIMDYITGN
ncbi:MULTISPECIES: winged helix-turn-helix domain-containing protein [unclassified Paenibacillus]|uniref:ArsR/SmtB family transcription factor n=1 Tax=unclassified Paenibacillus TaxID=185978 RepID=UPI0010464425|nr:MULTISPECIES: winged helix-turn-helix domain-containing protein [unclassified Paenibacillus]NIK69095.1 DNA-binding transcriptional ArsR family regulator [Paenibacillus sp. BK720]TCM89098.1 DNA-binding transcriptional ArsR family regulator [Paenibacillus sp. BK033]